jgi:hypothetical protein
MLDIRTFDARQGGNVLYKALAHPLAADALQRLYASLAPLGPIALFDPENVAAALAVMHPDLPEIEGVYVQDVQAVGQIVCGMAARPLTDLASPRGSASCCRAAWRYARSTRRDCRRRC